MASHEEQRKQKFDKIINSCKPCKTSKNKKGLDIDKLENEFNVMFEEKCDLERRVIKHKNASRKAEAKISELLVNHCRSVGPKEKFLNVDSTLPVISGAREENDTFIVGPKDSIMLQHHFVLKKLIGKGSYGTVFKVICKNNKNALKVKLFLKQKTHFLKIIEKKKVEDKGRQKLLQDEVDILSKMSHPNIVQLECCFEDEKSVYILMEYCAQNSLHHFIKNRSNKVNQE